MKESYVMRRASRQQQTFERTQRANFGSVLLELESRVGKASVGKCAGLGGLAARRIAARKLRARNSLEAAATVRNHVRRAPQLSLAAAANLNLAAVRLHFNFCSQHTTFSATALAAGELENSCGFFSWPAAAAAALTLVNNAEIERTFASSLFRVDVGQPSGQPASANSGAHGTSQHQMEAARSERARNGAHKAASMCAAAAKTRRASLERRPHEAGRLQLKQRALEAASLGAQPAE